jgi:hypothetical protein
MSIKTTTDFELRLYGFLHRMVTQLVTAFKDDPADSIIRKRSKEKPLWAQNRGYLRRLYSGKLVFSLPVPRLTISIGFNFALFFFALNSRDQYSLKRQISAYCRSQDNNGIKWKNAGTFSDLKPWN